jgi:acylphosphatase
MCKRAFVSGRVQGVGYRAFARSTAQELGLNGHARNLPDGRVEVLACGASDAIDTLIEHLRQGPRWSSVSGVEVQPAECTGPGFRTV